MIELNLNKSKILNNEQYSSKIGYDTRLYKECGSLAASCLFNKAKILCSKGEFGISDQDFSNMIGLPLRTFERAKKILKDRLGMRIGRGNKTYYSLINDLPYDPISYRSFDLNYLSITNNSYKLSAFLGQCFYWWNKALEKGEMEFSKTDKQIIDDLPFLSQDILTSIKKVAVLKGFISIKRKKRGGEWGVSHYTLYPNRIEKDIKEKCVSKSPLNDIILVVAVPKPSAKIPIECPPKSRLSVRQNPDSIINKPIYSSILSSAIDQNASDKPICEVISKERKKIKNKEDEQPVGTPNQSPKTEMEEIMNEPIKPWREKKEIYTMIGIWKEIISSDETIILSSNLKLSLQDAFEKKFDNSIEKWRAYCGKISDIDFLMGNNPSKWKAKLFWAIKPDKIDNILEGRYYCNKKKKRISYKTDQKPITLDKRELIDEVFSSDEPMDIKKIRISLIDSMDKFNKGGLMSYHTYLRHAGFQITHTEDKCRLIIKSSSRVREELIMSYEELMVQTLFSFDEVIVFAGQYDRTGSQLYMERSKNINTDDIKPCRLWESICREKGFHDESKDLKSGTQIF